MSTNDHVHQDHHHHAGVEIVEREPTLHEIQYALNLARQEGLPEQYHVQWDETGRKYFSHQNRKFTTLPQALAHAVSVGLLPPDKLPESYQDRELSAKEMETALKEARDQGLPESFTCRWDNQKRRRVWLTPNGKRIKGGIPAALKAAAELGLISKDSIIVNNSNKNSSVEEKILLAEQEAVAHGLEGWTVIWDEKYHQKVYVAPDHARKLYGLDKAIAYAVKKGWLPLEKMPKQFAKDRELTKEETQKAWKAAKKKHLPETWTVVWDSNHHRRVWVAPDNRRCDCISKAVAYSVQKGWLDPSKVSQKTSLTPIEEQAALAEARERGLPSCFQVRWNSKKNQKQWIAPSGKVCNSIPGALQYATKHGLLNESSHAAATNQRKRPQTRLISPRPLKQAALTQLVDVALDDLQELVQHSTDNHATAPTANVAGAEDEHGNHEPNDGGDFAWAGFHEEEEDAHAGASQTELHAQTQIVETEGPPMGKTFLSQHEIDTAMEQARLRGLPTGWTVLWDAKRKRRVWVSPCGKYKCRGIPSAIQKSVELGLIAEEDIPATAAAMPKEGPHSSTNARAAAAIRNAKHRGLPDSWTVEFLEDGRRSLRWRSPDGRVAKTLAEALKMSVEMGILSLDQMPIEYRERTLTPAEVEQSLKEAAARGLPPGWSVTWNSSRRQKIWISPDGKTKCDSINKALKASVRLGLLSPDSLPATLQTRELTQEEINAALGDARAKGLTCDGWRLEWNATKGCKRWISPDGKRRCECISKAIAYSKRMGWIPHTESS